MSQRSTTLASFCTNNKSVFSLCAVAVLCHRDNNSVPLHFQYVTGLHAVQKCLSSGTDVQPRMKAQVYDKKKDLVQIKNYNKTTILRQDVQGQN